VHSLGNKCAGSEHLHPATFVTKQWT